jgi:hypothetical protein
MVGTKKELNKVKTGLLLGGMIIVLMFVGGVGFQTFGVGADFVVNAAIEELRYGGDFWSPGVEYPGVVTFYGVDKVVADFDVVPASVNYLMDDKAKFEGSVYCIGSINTQGVEGFDIVPYEELVISDEITRKSYKLIFEASFITRPEVTPMDVGSYLWDVVLPDAGGVLDLPALGYTNYMPAGGVITGMSWLFSMTKVKADSNSKILAATIATTSSRSSYRGPFGTINIASTDLKPELSAIYGDDYAFSQGFAYIETTETSPIVTESEIDLRMNWDVQMTPMVLLGEGVWVPVTTEIVQRFYVDITVDSAETEPTADEPAPPIVSGPESFTIIQGEALSIPFSASSLNPAIVSVYEQDYYEDQEFTLDLTEPNLLESGEWNGGDVAVDVSSLIAGRYAITVVVEDTLGETSQHTTFLLVTESDAEHVATDGYSVADRTAPGTDNVVDSVVSGYIPRARDSPLDMLMDNPIYIGVIVVVVIIIGGIAFMFLTKKPKTAKGKKRKTRR